MAIDAYVAYVECREDGSGTLHLCDRVPKGSRGQSRLHFTTAPYEVTALNGLPVWGGAGQLLLGDTEIAKREGYTRISFNERDVFLAAVADYHRRRRRSRRRAPMPETPCATGHTWSNQFGDDWTPEVGTPCDCGKKKWGIPLSVAREHQWEFYMNGTFCRRCGAAIGSGQPCR